MRSTKCHSSFICNQIQKNRQQKTDSNNQNYQSTHTVQYTDACTCMYNLLLLILLMLNTLNIRYFWVLLTTTSFLKKEKLDSLQEKTNKQGNEKRY